jgi:hypothetical protein
MSPMRIQAATKPQKQVPSGGSRAAGLCRSVVEDHTIAKPELSHTRARCTWRTIPSQRSELLSPSGLVASTRGEQLLQKQESV